MPQKIKNTRTCNHQNISTFDFINHRYFVEMNKYTLYNIFHDIQYFKQNGFLGLNKLNVLLSDV